MGSLTRDVLAAFPVGTPPAEFGQALAWVTRTMSPPASTPPGHAPERAPARDAGPARR
jgi:hypothetical protein